MSQGDHRWLVKAGRASGKRDSQGKLGKMVRFGKSMKGGGGREGKANMVGVKGSEGTRELGLGEWWGKTVMLKPQRA